MTKWTLSLTLCLATLAWSASRIEFTPSQLDLGTLKQGVKIPVTLTGKNLSKDTIQVEQIIPQGIGPQSIIAPSTIYPQSEFNIQFDYNTQLLKGKQFENITLIVGDDEFYPVEITAIVLEAFQFSEPVVNLGYVEKVSQISFYIWPHENLKSFHVELDEKFSKAIKMKTKPVFLDLKDLSKVKESASGKFGLKVNLEIDIEVLTQGETRKSINKLISFKSSEFPNAIPEIQITGFKK